ncbi:MAG: (2Fe-2S)-binding protein [Myxococcales bacterium]|nr:(2Fe-2S)-binding protein [Myxococcales bacterium]
MIALNVNGERHEVDVEPEAPLLWVLREELGLRGTKFGCGLALCGACTVHLNGRAVRSCVTPVGSVGASEIRTIEALGTPEKPHPVQRAWLDLQVPQCGYCQPGMQMAAAALLTTTPEPTDEDIDQGITNVCRCGCYERIREAIHVAADAPAEGEER